MLFILGITMIIVFTFLIMSKRMSPIVALTLVPIIFAVIGGFGQDLGSMMLEGIKLVASSAALLLFAILFFGILIDAGLFDPLIKKILKIVKGDPVKIAIGTSVLSLIVALDGDGTTTYMITVSAMLPLYKRIGMNPLVLAAISMLSLSIMSGMTPWGGPATRAITVLGLDGTEFFVPFLPTMVGGVLWVIFTAFILGKKERKRIGIVDIQYSSINTLVNAELAPAQEQMDIKRPKLLWINLFLVVSIMIILVMEWLPSPVLFLIGFVIALIINYPKVEEQKERILAHAGNALTVVVLVFAAGVFSGILSGTKMVDTIANTLVAIIPESLGPFFPTIVAITSMPFTFVLSNDAYYFGVLPILAKAAAAYGIDPVEIARASILGQPVHLMSPLVVSTILLVGMVDRDIGEHQRFTCKWAIFTSLVITSLALMTGAISLM
ncbi:CitMHS family transporter [Thermoflavimicrobium dichotomicum]|uniref:Citrate-Mg2+:H+ or citrate-Ca2+:H+ symporter, CitMHS family n=1 Tax=Thermoflavimicrobium dichotomicum TaxID=46223 RepID=A0A1I3MU97_9BACL|nr:citrate:proton symporter [Thermoflavimicrobium dichotomicum]SFJ00256.1 citrate-Mg2+:H+ or citrate-Ca2+:H+ symporter, CitMHS family [Thermoflavimicrobium dichotomicum]